MFLSYSRKDTPFVDRLRHALGALGVAVRIDIDSMVPGQSIRAFIMESIRQTEATVWVVSKDSLLSGWVSNEIAVTLRDIDLWSKRKLVACYLDDGFLDPEFRLAATETIDARIAQIDAMIPRYQAKHLDTNDLNAEKSQLHELRSNLGTLLERLRGSHCVHVRDDNFNAGVQLLASALCPALTRAGAAARASPNDIEHRCDEIYSLIAAGDATRALKRSMDFVRDFSEDKQHLKDVVVINSEYTMAEGVNLKETLQERKRLLHEALSLLDSVVESMTRRAAE